MEKLINDFSWGLALWQLFNIALLVFFVYFIYKIYKYINRPGA